MGLRDLLRHKKEQLSADDEPAVETTAVPSPLSPRRDQSVELGTINYVNLSADQRHGDINVALQAARAADKPIFANFVEWSG